MPKGGKDYPETDFLKPFLYELQDVSCSDWENERSELFDNIIHAAQDHDH